MIRVLVTGGAGFIGSAMVEYLLEHYPDMVVRAMDLNRPPAEGIERLTGSIEPQPITYEEFMALVPEKFEWVDGYLFDPPHRHQWRERLLALLLTNEGLIQTVQMVPLERWLEALKQTYGKIAKTPRRHMTYEEFLEWADEDTWAEWVDGEVMILSPASPRHQDIADFLTSVLRMYAELKGLGRVISAPFQMKLERGREPDVLFVAREHLERLLETRLEGPADLVVEVMSPDSVTRDRGEKFYEYEAGGVREYWLLDPDRRWAEFYHLGADGRYQTIFAGAEGEYNSEVLSGFWLRVEWLWQEPLPHPLRALGEIAGVDPQMVDRFLQALGGER